MDKSRVKNFIIILLALVNLFLLFIVISNGIEESRGRAYRLSALEKVLAENGITLSPEIEIPGTIPPLLSLKRDLDAERKRLSALIGSCQVADQGGNAYFYDGTDGQARSRGTGEFEMKLNSGVISKGKDPVATAKSAMKKLGIECADIAPIVTENGSEVTVTLYCAQNGTPVRNAQISFVFAADNLLLVTGTRPLEEKSAAQSSESYPDGVTVLMNFFNSISQTGKVCSEINGLTIEYYMYSAVSGNCTLEPVWSIQTNVGTYYIDAATGKSETIQGAA